jgi:integrating conjugative element protein (TIGR03761 family)
MRLLTRNALGYVWGWHKDVLGLFQFAKRVTPIVKAASQDDPYADLTLLRLHDGLFQTHYYFTRQKIKYKSLIDDPRNCGRKLVGDAIIIPSHFSSAYGYLAADIISGYDQIMSLVLTAKYTGVRNFMNFNEVAQTLKITIDPVLNLPLKWHNTGVTRDDVRQQTPLAQEASQLMGQVPDIILKGELRATHAPPITGK